MNRRQKHEIQWNQTKNTEEYRKWIIWRWQKREMNRKQKYGIQCNQINNTIKSSKIQWLSDDDKIKKWKVFSLLSTVSGLQSTVSCLQPTGSSLQSPAYSQQSTVSSPLTPVSSTLSCLWLTYTISTYCVTSIHCLTYEGLFG